MSELRTSFVLDLVGNLSSRSRQFGRDLDGLSRRGSRSMQALSRATSAAGRGLDRLGNRYTALLTGAAGIGAVRMIGNLSEHLSYLGIQAGVTDEKIAGLKARIFQVAQAADVRVSPDKLLSAIDQIVEKTGDLSFAEANLRNIGLAIRATGAEGSAIGGILAEFQKIGIKDPKQVMQALDVLNVQGKQGAFTLQNLAAMGPRVVSAYTAIRKGGGVDAIREMGATLQVIRMATGSSEQATTTFEALLRTLGDAQKLKLLRKGGIQVFDPEALKAGREELRPINEIVKEIFEKSKGRTTVLSQIFDAEAVRAFKSPDLVANLARFYQVQADGTATTGDAARAAHQFNAALTSLAAAGEQFAARELAGPVQGIADALNSLEPGTVQRWLTVGKWLGVGVGGAIAARKLYQGGRFITGLFGKAGGAGGLGGMAGAAGKFGDAIPVYVVNGPSSIWPGAGGANSPGGSVAKGAARLSPLAAVSAAMLPAALAAAVAAGSMTLEEALAKRQASAMSSNALRELGRRNEVIGGGSGNFQGRLISDELARRGENFWGTLKIEVDSKGVPLRVTQMQARGLDLDVDTGRTMTGH